MNLGDTNLLKPSDRPSCARPSS